MRNTVVFVLVTCFSIATAEYFTKNAKCAQSGKSELVDSESSCNLDLDNMHRQEQSDSKLSNTTQRESNRIQGTKVDGLEDIDKHDSHENGEFFKFTFQIKKYPHLSRNYTKKKIVKVKLDKLLSRRKT